MESLTAFIQEEALFTDGLSQLTHAFVGWLLAPVLLLLVGAGADLGRRRWSDQALALLGGRDEQAQALEGYREGSLEPARAARC